MRARECDHSGKIGAPDGTSLKRTARGDRWRPALAAIDIDVDTRHRHADKPAPPPAPRTRLGSGKARPRGGRRSGVWVWATLGIGRC